MTTKSQREALRFNVQLDEAVRDAVELGARAQNMAMVPSMVIVDGTPVDVQVVWDAEALTDEELEERTGRSGLERSVVASLYWGYNDGCFKLKVIGEGEGFQGCHHLETLSRHLVRSDWADLFGTEYAGQLDF